MLTSACQELYFVIAALQAAVGRRSRPSMGFAAFGHPWPSLPIAARSLTPARFVAGQPPLRDSKSNCLGAQFIGRCLNFGAELHSSSHVNLDGHLNTFKYVRSRYSWLMPIADRYNERPIASDSDYYLFAFDVFPSSPIDNNQRCSDGEGTKYLVGTETVLHYQPS